MKLSVSSIWILAMAASFAVVSVFAAEGAETPARKVELVVADGQLISHPFIVFVTHRVTSEMEPQIVFRGSHFALKDSEIENRKISPIQVAPDQVRNIKIDRTDQTVARTGTILVFDLNDREIPFFKSGLRLLPTLEWKTSDGTIQQAVASEEIYLGNIVGAVMWTGIAIVLLLILLLSWSYKKSKDIKNFKPRKFLLLITGPDGYLSLWRTQLIMWTFAVGGIVFLFGLVRLQIPEIPDTLVALMGMSLLTGGLSAAQGRKDAQKSNAVGGLSKKTVPPNMEGGSWADIISTWNDGLKQVELSVPKAQMVIWTTLILTLFITKSVLEGILWEVPWQMVALTGASQAGYVGEKYVRSAVPVDK